MKPITALLMLGLTFMAGSSFADVAIPPADDTQPTDAIVGVYARHSGGRVVYHYRVTNNSQQNITAVTIGRDNQNDANPANDVNELLSLPSGWNAKLGIPSTSSNTPTGWRVSVIDPEDNATHAIAWETLNDRSPQIRTGQTTSKLSITLDNPDTSYLNSHALVTFADNPVSLTVPVDRLDNNPPDLLVILSPETIAPQKDKYVAVNASFIIKDDYDRLPEIKLESITCNEPLEANDIRDASIGLDDRYFKFLADSRNSSGRIYTVTYSATDASGNQSIASATVTVLPSVAAPATESMPFAAPQY